METIMNPVLAGFSRTGPAMTAAGAAVTVLAMDSKPAEPQTAQRTRTYVLAGRPVKRATTDPAGCSIAYG